MSQKFNSFMEEAFNQAKIAFDQNEVPVGAIIVDANTNQIIAKSYNQNIALHDSTAHAEILVIRMACLVRGSSRLDGCDLYVTLEPCPMCASAISLSKIRRLYYGAPDPKSGGVINGAKIFSSSSCHHKPEVYGDIDGVRAGQLLRDFFVRKR